MKTILISLTGVLLAALLFSSCNGNLRVEKRHYRNGFYTGIFSAGTPDREAQKVSGEVPVGPAFTAADADEETAHDTIHEEDRSPLVTDTMPAKVLRTSIAETPAPDAIAQDTVKKEKKVRKLFSYKGPPETKKAGNLYRLGLLLIILGLLFYFVIFLPVVPYLGFLAWAFFAGIIVAVIAMIIASEGVGRNEGKNKDLEAAFRKIRRRGLWAVIGGLIARLVLLFTILLIAMFT